MKTYCIICKKETDGLRKETVKAKNNKLNLDQFVKNVRKTNIDFIVILEVILIFIIKYYHYYLK